MNTNEFLKAILPSEGIYLIAVKTDKGMRHKGFASIDEAAKCAIELDRKGLSVYHACSAYKDLPHKDETGKFIARTSTNWLSAKAFWVDIDCGEDKARDGKGYATQNEGAKALILWCRKYNFPIPMMVNSGRGLHAYWRLSEELPPKAWVETAGALKSLMQVDGLLADPSRTADFASVLRPVGTFNRKNPDNPKEVKVAHEGEVVDTTVFISLVLQAITDSGTGLPPTPDWMKTDEPESAIPHTSMPSYANLVADKCKQVAQMRDTQGDVGYEQWRGVIGIIKHSEEGIELAREWSARRAETGHTSLDVDTRYNTWGSAPTTCAFFESCNPEGCKNCPFRGKIKTPIVLGRVEPQQESETVTATLESQDTEIDVPVQIQIPELPSGYTWDGTRMVRIIPNKDGVLTPHSFSPVRFYLITRIQEADAKMAFVARAHLPRGLVREFRIPGNLVGGGGNELMKLLGSYEVFTDNTKDALIHMHAYIKDSVKKLTDEQSVVTTHVSFGWKPDGSFLIGERLYRPNGTSEQVLLSGYALTQQNVFPAPMGTIEEYSKNLNWVYNRDGMQPMQYLICSLWAAPLVDLCEPTYNGIPCALTGADSGKGKSTAALAGLYAFGQASPGLCIAGVQGATAKAQAAFLGTMSNLPVLFDEVTNMNVSMLSNLCFSLSNGTEPMRLKSAAGHVVFSNRESWRTHTAITGNTNIRERLATNGNVQAEVMRFFEIRVDEYDIPRLDPLEVSNALSEMEANQGCAGHALIQYMVTHKKEVKALLRESMDGLLKAQDLVTEPRYRYFRNHIACTMTAAKIMKKLGVIDFDLDKLEAFAITAIRKMIISEADFAMVDPVDTLSDMVLDLSPRIITTETFDLPQGRVPYQVSCPQGIVGRRIQSTGNMVDPKYNNRLLIQTSHARQWCVDHRVDMSKMIRELTKLGVLLSTTNRAVLGKNTNLTTTQQRVWEIDLTKLQGD